MSLICCRNIARLLPVAAISIFISGCGTMMNPVFRKPLFITPMETSLAPCSQAILVRFESTLPGEPLAETVWDNQSGAFADVAESNQIGFTQDYSSFTPDPDYGLVGAVVNGGIDTQIVIPFGRIFEEVFQSGLQKVFTNSSVCFDDTGESKELQTGRPRSVVRLKVMKVYIWENPVNHLNLNATVQVSVCPAGKPDQAEYIYVAYQEVMSQPLGSILSTSSHFIKEMNKAANGLAAALSEEILENLKKQPGH